MLTKNRVKIALQADKVQIGVLQSIPDAGITEVLGGAGFATSSWLMQNMEALASEIWSTSLALQRLPTWRHW